MPESVVGRKKIYIFWVLELMNYKSNAILNLQFQINFRLTGFEVLTAVAMNTSFFWNIMPCSQVKVNRRFGGIRRLHLQGRRIFNARK
jgi:hypothetical protein